MHQHVTFKTYHTKFATRSTKHVTLNTAQLGMDGSKSGSNRVIIEKNHATENNLVVPQVAIGVELQRKEDDEKMGKTIIFKVLEKDDTDRGGAIVKTIKNVAKVKGVDTVLETRSIGGVVGRKRMKVTDLMSTPFEEGVGNLLTSLGGGQKLDIICGEMVSSPDCVQAKTKNDENVVIVGSGDREPSGINEER